MDGESPFPRSVTGQIWRLRGDASQADDLVDQLLLWRGCAPDDLPRHRHPTIRAFMPDPAIFRDMEVAAQRLADAVIGRERIVVFGDYDVDGATSAALLIRLLRGLGVEADHYIPDRLMEGYGPSGEALVQLARAGADLIITVDCGAQAFEALEMARSERADVVIVDHHKCAATLPAAFAIVNPNRLDEAEGAAFGHLAAVGVAWLLAAATVRALRARTFFAARPEPDLLELLDLVALGTVADVAQLRGLNRAFVTQGLKVMARRRNPGIAALFDVARLDRAPQCSDLGFVLGPRINAGGRIGKADLGVTLLTTDDGEKARAIAAELDRLNEERRAIEAAVQAEAEKLAECGADAPVLLVAQQGWHPGIIGIVAGRLKERFKRPAIVVAIDEKGIGKGSGRSIAGVDLGAAVLAAKDHGLLLAGGGHAMAAGLTVEAGKIEALRTFLCDRLAADFAHARSASSLLIDAVTAPAGLSPGLVETLEQAGPFGVGWPAPRVATGPVRVVRTDVVGAGHVRAIMAGDDGRSFKTIGFRQAETALGQALLHGSRDRRLWLAGRARIDDWSGRASAELHLEDAAFVD